MLILASASPRRRELLTQAGFSFEVIPSSVAEVRAPGEAPIPFCARLAREKAEAVFAEYQASLDTPEDPLLVLGADTIVVTGPEAGSEILGKPADADDAARMLALLSGRTHQVITGVCVVSRAGAETAAEVTYVTMRTLTEAEIAAYIATGEPMGKAGAYAIQGYAGQWIPQVRGCYFNVVGLPLALTTTMIEGVRRRLGTTTKPPLSTQ
jgi:septum formation protein